MKICATGMNIYRTHILMGYSRYKGIKQYVWYPLLINISVHVLLIYARNSYKIDHIWWFPNESETYTSSKLFDFQTNICKFQHWKLNFSPKDFVSE